MTFYVESCRMITLTTRCDNALGVETIPLPLRRHHGETKRTLPHCHPPRFDLTLYPPIFPPALTNAYGSNRPGEIPSPSTMLSWAKS
jgi:hypothetical protein